jgi:hypothetical protein
MTTQTTADIVAACMSAVADRDPRIVAALDYIEGAARLLDDARSDAARLKICFDALDTIQGLLSRPAPSTVSQ